MTWLLTWLNVSVAILNAMLQLLVIYRYRLQPSSSKKKLKKKTFLLPINSQLLLVILSSTFPLSL